MESTSLYCDPIQYTRGPLLSQCAESRVYECDFYGLPAVCKHRFEKKYRHPKLDVKLRDQRTVREARALVRCGLAGIRVPDVYAVHRQTSEIIMERIQGKTVKEVFDEELLEMQQWQRQQQQQQHQQQPQGQADAPSSSSSSNSNTSTSMHIHTNEVGSTPATTRQRPRCPPPPPLPSLTIPPLVLRLLEGIGEVVGLVHQNGMVHGDLTTSNFMYVPPVAASRCCGGATGDTASSSAALTTVEGTSFSTPSPAREGLVIIDFGLILDKITPEDRAVDLYVLLRAFSSTHPWLESIAEERIMEGYRRTVKPKAAEATLQRLEVVRARGRKRSMVG